MAKTLPEFDLPEPVQNRRFGRITWIHLGDPNDENYTPTVYFDIWDNGVPALRNKATNLKDLLSSNSNPTLGEIRDMINNNLDQIA